jgi:hypothetical protein
MTCYLFVGPTLPDAADLPLGAAVRVLPPVAGGHLPRLRPRAGDIVGIVDGNFHHTAAVRHKEILACLSAGARVLGAASMGALRAAELDSFGMEGIGGIYRDYRDGVLEADDEVALAHAPAEYAYRPHSEPLVNIRATLGSAERHGLIDAARRTMLTAALARMPYWRRSYHELTKVAREQDVPDAGELSRFCAAFPVNRKRQDALSLLNAMRDPPPRDRPPVTPVSRTLYAYSWELAASVTGKGDGEEHVPDLAALRLCQLFAADYPALHRRRVLDSLRRECAGRCGPPVDPDPATAAVAHGVHRGVYGPPASAAGFGFLRQWLTADEQSALDLREQVVTFLVRSFRLAPRITDDQGALDLLRGSPAFAKARTLVPTAMEHIRHHREASAPDAARLLGWVARLWDAEPDASPEELELRALDRGLESIPLVVRIAYPYYFIADRVPDLLRLRVGARP